MLGWCSIVTWCILSALLLFIADSCHSCFACHLQTVHPFPVIFISISTEIISSFQWHAWFAKLLPCPSIFLPEHAYASHIISCISYMFCIMLLVHFSLLIVVPLLVFLSWVEPGDEFVNEEPVEYAYEDQAFDNSENLAGKMTTPRNHFYLCFASCSLCCHAAYHLLYHVSHFAMSAPNHPFLANRCLAKLPLLLSPLIALLVAGEVEVCSMSEHGYVGISQYLLFN